MSEQVKIKASESRSGDIIFVQNPYANLSMVKAKITKIANYKFKIDEVIIYYEYKGTEFYTFFHKNQTIIIFK
tara:strand:+ start:10325 stop:10543 length:219 start_codon:yes stop_codon:yes gene_type:complete